MRNHTTLLVLDTKGSPARQFTISKILVFFIGFFITACISVFGYGVYDYYSVKQENVRVLKIQDRIRNKDGVILKQRLQIQNFAFEINALKAEILALNNFEKKIRLFADLAPDDKDEGVFGIGGSAPEDLDTSLDLNNKHNDLIREMHGQIEQLELAADRKKQKFNKLFKQLDSKKSLLASTPAIRPVNDKESYITSKFGRRKSPFTGLIEHHKGLDIAARKGTPIYATANGIITFAGRKGPLGNLVVIDHGHGMVTRYAHTLKYFKKRGDRVKRGELIAEVGNTGRSTGPHVHYEVRLNGIAINPDHYILN